MEGARAASMEGVRVPSVEGVRAPSVEGARALSVEGRWAASMEGSERAWRVGLERAGWPDGSQLASLGAESQGGWEAELGAGVRQTGWRAGELTGGWEI